MWILTGKNEKGEKQYRDRFSGKKVTPLRRAGMLENRIPSDAFGHMGRMDDPYIRPHNAITGSMPL
jgi:hypothetical protein